MAERVTTTATAAQPFYTGAVLQHALAYAADGLSVIPIQRGDKRPAVNWTPYQTHAADVTQVQTWFGNGAGYEALGIVTGDVSGGLAILDFDGDGWERARDDLLTAFPDLRNTRQVHTGSGRLHIWLAAADTTDAAGQPITRLAFNRPDLGAKTAIELRVNQSQTLAPPSLHPSGGHYEFYDPDAPILRLPDLRGLAAWLTNWTQTATTPTPTPTPTPEKRKAGRPAKSVANIETLRDLFITLGYDLALCLLDDSVWCNGRLFSDVERDVLLAEMYDYLSGNGYRLDMQQVARVITLAAAEKPFHPVKQYFESLQWDGFDHIEQLCGYFTEANGGGSFPRWFELWLIGAVARVYESHQNPVLTLLGAQHAGKSYFAKWLAAPLPGMFQESAIYPESKDSRLQLTNTFLWEISELPSTVRRADVDAFKAFLTLERVRLRKAFGRLDIDKPAITSFIATANPDGTGLLADPTGNRRFLVVELAAIDWRYAELVNVNQLWAQAYHAYTAGDDWRMTAEERVIRDAQNEKHETVNPLDDWLDRHVKPDPAGALTFEELWANWRLAVGDAQYKSASMALARWAKRQGVGTNNFRPRKYAAIFGA